MNISIPLWLILSFVSLLLCLPLFLYNIVHNGFFSNTTQEPFLSRQNLIAGLTALVFGVVFILGGYYTFGGIMAGIASFMIMSSLWELRKQKNLEVKTVINPDIKE